MSTNPPVPPDPGFGAPVNALPPPPPRKTSPIVWILVGIGGFFVLIILVAAAGLFFIAHKAKQAGLDGDLLRRNPALATAKIMVAANPDVEMVSSDEGKGEITIRDKKTGKVFNISFEDAKNGKFTMKEDGKAASLTIGGAAKVPTWVPDYPGSSPQGAFSAQGQDGDTGTFTFKTKDPSDKVTQFYQDQFKALGLKIVSNVASQTGSASGGMVMGQDEAQKHTVTAVISTEGGETTVAVTYATGK